MPRKARPPGKVTWILLNDAVNLIADAYPMQRTAPSRHTFFRGAGDPAENMLDRAVRAGDVPVQFARFEGKWVEGEKAPSLTYAWEHGRINARLSSIYLQVRDKGFGTYYRVEVGLEAVRKLLPKGYEPPLPQAPATMSKPRRGGGRSDQYDWDVVFSQVLRLLDDEGWPEIRSYRVFAKKVCDACADFGMEPVPSEDRVREKLSVWFSARSR